VRETGQLEDNRAGRYWGKYHSIPRLMDGVFFFFGGGAMGPRIERENIRRQRNEILPKMILERNIGVYPDMKIIYRYGTVRLRHIRCEIDALSFS
jgi:hypothetical protein